MKRICVCILGFHTCRYQ